MRTVDLSNGWDNNKGLHLFVCVALTFLTVIFFWYNLMRVFDGGLNSADDGYLVLVAKELALSGRLLTNPASTITDTVLKSFLHTSSISGSAL